MIENRCLLSRTYVNNTIIFIFFATFSDHQFYDHLLSMTIISGDHKHCQQNLIDSLTPNTKEQVAYQVCKQKVDEAGKEKVKIDLSGRMGGGKGRMGKLEFLTPYGEKTKVALITAEFFMEVCSTLKMAPTNAMKLRQLLLKHPNIRVESYLKDKLQERRHELDQFFSVQEMSFYVYPDEHDIDDLLESDTEF